MSKKVNNTKTTPVVNAETTPVVNAVSSIGEEMTVLTFAEVDNKRIESLYTECKNENAVNISKAISTIDDLQRDADLRKAVLLLAIREHQMYRDLGCSTFEEYGQLFHDIEKSQLNKYCRIADKFITIEHTDGEVVKKISAKGGETDLAVITSNDFKVTGMVDKFHKPFSMSAMNEMLTIGNDGAKLDILVRLINAGTIYSKSPANSGDKSVRAILKREFTTAGLITPNSNNATSANNDTNNSVVDNTVKAVNEKADDFTDKDRLNMIVSIVSSIRNEELKKEFIDREILQLCEVWIDDVK